MKNTLTPYVGHLVKVNVATDDKGKGGVFLLANVTDEVVVLRVDRNSDTGTVYNLQHVIGLVPQRQTEKLQSPAPTEVKSPPKRSFSSPTLCSPIRVAPAVSRRA